MSKLQQQNKTKYCHYCIVPLYQEGFVGWERGGGIKLSQHAQNTCKTHMFILRVFCDSRRYYDVFQITECIALCLYCLACAFSDQHIMAIGFYSYWLGIFTLSGQRFILLLARDFYSFWPHVLLFLKTSSASDRYLHTIVWMKVVVILTTSPREYRMAYKYMSSIRHMHRSCERVVF